MMSKQQQRQVWQRVYHPVQARPIPLQLLRQSRMRLRENLKFYESQTGHPIYGPAFQRLVSQTREQMEMLRQMGETR